MRIKITKDLEGEVLFGETKIDNWPTVVNNKLSNIAELLKLKDGMRINLYLGNSETPFLIVDEEKDIRELMVFFEECVSFGNSLRLYERTSGGYICPHESR